MGDISNSMGYPSGMNPKLRFFSATIVFLALISATPSALGNELQGNLVSKKFSNCAALTKVFPGGVAKSSKTVNKGGEIKNKPTVNAKVYADNAGKDRDKDGIACEN